MKTFSPLHAVLYATTAIAGGTLDHLIPFRPWQAPDSLRAG